MTIFKLFVKKQKNRVNKFAESFKPAQPVITSLFLDYRNFIFI